MLECVEEVNESKRFKAYFTNGKTTEFGQSNAKQGTYIDHGDKTLRKNYIKRHLRDLKTNDYTKPGYLSMSSIWDKPTLKENIIAYNKRMKNDDWEIKI